MSDNVFKAIFLERNSMENQSSTSGTKVASTPKSSSTPTFMDKEKRKIPVIEVIDAFKHYGLANHWRLVLKNFTLAVYPGEIFALLGPHSSGKSTIINIVLGLKTLTEGSVEVFGFPPRHELSGIPGIRVGYTPQSRGLYEQLSVSEILRYYGNILGLKKQYMEERIGFLTHLLALPNEDVHIMYCPETMKRQISFAIALLHEPELMILDEPTAGVDPVLKKCMWAYLETLARTQDKTVLVATQSCIEARDSDRVGILYDGQISLCGKPKELLSKYKEVRVENIYMKVYANILDDDVPEKKKSQIPLFQDRTQQKVSGTMVPEIYSEGFMYDGRDERAGRVRRKSRTWESCFLHCNAKLRIFCPNCRRLCYVIMKDFCRCFRSYVFLTMVILLPAIFVTIFSYTIGQTPKNLKIGIVNEESPDECKENYINYVSCQVLNLIDNEFIKFTSYKSQNEAKKAMDNLESHGTLIIGKEFTPIFHRLFMGLITDKEIAYPYNFTNGYMYLHMDMTNKFISSTLQLKMEEALNRYIKLATKGTVIEKSTINSLVIMPPSYGKMDAPETDYMLPGLCTVIIYYLSSFVAAQILISDRLWHVYERDYLAGVRVIETVISIMLVHGIMLLIEVVILYIVAFLIMESELQENSMNLFPICIMTIWCGLTFGVLVSIVTKTRVAAGILVFCFLAGSILLCGILNPIESLPNWMQYVVIYLPNTFAAAASRNILMRGFTIVQKQVYMGVLVPTVWFLIFVTTSLLANKITY